MLFLLLCFSQFSVLFLHIICCAFSYLILPPSFLHLSAYMNLFPQSSSSHKTQCILLESILIMSHKFGIVNNSITFYSNRFLIFTSISKLICLLSAHVFLTTLLIFFLSISATTNAHRNSPGIAYTFCKTPRCSFHINKK